MSPSVSTTMIFNAFFLEPRLGMKILSLNRRENEDNCPKGCLGSG